MHMMRMKKIKQRRKEYEEKHKDDVKLEDLPRLFWLTG